ncbi:hypothetical protein ABRP29_15950 [Pseudomonas sp. WHRI 8822A]|uniref:hypothetical protein n=1 Tax=Pseudomonas sp. WHRI 8822A TaxID=3162568 RepID=UPI0032EDAF30
MKTALKKEQLIERANQELKAFPGYKAGMEITDARMEKHVLVMDAKGMMQMDGESLDLDVVDAYNSFGKQFAEVYTLTQ